MHCAKNSAVVGTDRSGTLDLFEAHSRQMPIPDGSRAPLGLVTAGYVIVGRLRRPCMVHYSLQLVSNPYHASKPKSSGKKLHTNCHKIIQICRFLTFYLGQSCGVPRLVCLDCSLPNNDICKSAVRGCIKIGSTHLVGTHGSCSSV